MPSSPTVSARNLSKMYALYANPRDRLNQSLWYALPSFLRTRERRFFREFWALRDISLEIRPGEVLGIIGPNGSGKSTLLQILAGTLAPSGGDLEINGTRAALLELGSGFSPDFTGRENVHLAGSILGMSSSEIEKQFAEIAAFADIGEFIDQPVKLYSSGMYVRLAFAIQTSVRPDLLVVDEVLSVGDIFFQQKCFDRLGELLSAGTAVALVSHDMGVIQKFSSQTMLLRQGECVFSGQPNEAVQRYYLMERGAAGVLREPGAFAAKNSGTPAKGALGEWPDPEVFLSLAQAAMLGSGEARCTGIALCRKDGRPGAVFEIGETAYFFCEYDILKDIEVPVFGVTLTNSMNVPVHGKNSAQGSLEAPNGVQAGSRVRVRQRIEMRLAPGQYTFSVGFSSVPPEAYAQFSRRPYAHFHQQEQVLSLIERAGVFQIVPRNSGLEIPFHGSADLPGDFALEVLSV